MSAVHSQKASPHDDDFGSFETNLTRVRMKMRSCSEENAKLSPASNNSICVTTACISKAQLPIRNRTNPAVPGNTGSLKLTSTPVSLRFLVRPFIVEAPAQNSMGNSTATLGRR